MDNRTEELVGLHKSFWERTLPRPIINDDCSTMIRSSLQAVIPDDIKASPDGTLQPSMLFPSRHQPKPLRFNGTSDIHGKVAFNTLFPHSRIPWLTGIVGCKLKVYADVNEIQPVSCCPDNWYELEDLGFAPNPEWREKLLEFVRYITERYWPGQAVPTLDAVARGPGDLLLHVLSTEKMYVAMYEHPRELKRLLAQITELYIEWASSQLEIIPQMLGGYCNQYGLWCPGTCIRTQEDFAVNLSAELFSKFLLPSATKVAAAFEYQVFHTYSGFAQLAEWVLPIEDLQCIEMVLDPYGPPYHELLDLWNHILERKNLIIVGPMTQEQLDGFVDKLSPSGLMLDIRLVNEEELSTAWD